MTTLSSVGVALLLISAVGILSALIGSAYRGAGQRAVPRPRVSATRWLVGWLLCGVIAIILADMLWWLLRLF